MTALVLLAAAIGCDEQRGGGSPATGDTMVIGFIGGPGSETESVRHGVEMGAAEAEHAGRLVGRPVSLVSARASSPAEAAAAARQLVDRGALALIGGFDEASCRQLAAVAERRNVIFLNVGCRADDLRGGSGAGTFHVEASDSMYRAAAATAEPGDTVVLWHPRLSRYGAGQLIDRFQRRRIDQDGGAWAGWMAVKIVWEALLESPEPSGDALSAVLTSGRLVFDGHKGEPLRFDSASRQLAQPLYSVDPAELAMPAVATVAAGGEELAPAVPLTGGVYAFVSNEGSADVSVIDLSDNRVVSRIPVGARPRGIRAAPDGERILVALSDDAPLAESDRDAVAVIDLRRGEVVGRYSVGSDPEQFDLGPDGTILYAANEDAGTASVTDLRTGDVLATLIVGIEPEGVAVSPDGRWVYVTAETSNTVSVIDAGTNEVVASFLVDARPRGVAFSPAAPRAYVTNEISGTVSVVDTDSHEVIASIELDPHGRAKPVGVAVSPDGRWVYVANGHAHSMAVIDARANRVTAEIPVGRRPWGLAVSADGDRVYTANGGSDDVSVIDTATRRVIATVPVGSRPWGVAISEMDGR